MVRVTLVRDGSPATGWWHTVKAEGHAIGSVAMCAAVSTLMQTIESYLRLKHAAISKNVIEPGNCELRFSGNTAAFEIAYAGFLGLQGADPELVQVEVRKK